MKKMHIIKFLLVAVFAINCSSAWADIALPKSDKLNTKYYFANVDSFSNYTFFARKTVNNKTYKLKQDAAFLLQTKDGTEQELEVWAVNNESKKESNSFKLNLAKYSQQIPGNVAYIAIQFSFDKTGKLTHKQTVMKPDCYSPKKRAALGGISNNSTSHSTTNDHSMLLLTMVTGLAFSALLALHKLKMQKAYV